MDKITQKQKYLLIITTVGLLSGLFLGDYLEKPKPILLKNSVDADEHSAPDPDVSQINHHNTKNTKEFHDNLRNIAKQLFLTGKCDDYIKGVDTNLESDVTIMGTEPPVVLNNSSQKLLARFYRGQISSLDELYYTLTLNSQTIPKNQAKYIMETISQSI